jgi:hypothetical protein
VASGLELLEHASDENGGDGRSHEFIEIYPNASHTASSKSMILTPFSVRNIWKASGCDVTVV